MDSVSEVPEHFEKLAQIEKLYGHLVVKGNEGIPDLSFLPYLGEIRSSNKKNFALEVHDNQNFVVKGLDSIKLIDGDAKIITEKDTDAPSAFKKHITDVTTGKASFSSRKCRGGQIGAEYLDKIGDSCREIIGDLIIQGLTETPKDIARLAGVEKIHGRLVVKGNTAVKDLSFLTALREISNPISKEPSLEIADNLNFALNGLTSIKKIHGNVYILSEKESDVSSVVKQHITSITDGTATFLVKQKTAGGAQTSKQGTTPSEAPTSIKKIHSGSVKAVTETGVTRTLVPISEQKNASKSEHHGSAKGGGSSAIWIVVILVVIFVLLALAMLGVIFANKYMKKQHNAKPAHKEVSMSHELGVISANKYMKEQQSAKTADTEKTMSRKSRESLE
ncbi:hypothetical protein GCK32_001332 [Trichostrongylus colubriformis]|uniref:Receptor L-domain domain-containing protein n=1 Tax=Trichostrongylus colubriformis TaxID=6319 RepID=A0AAN8EW67_TRICO